MFESNIFAIITKFSLKEIQLNFNLNQILGKKIKLNFQILHFIGKQVFFYQEKKNTKQNKK